MSKVTDVMIDAAAGSIADPKTKLRDWLEAAEAVREPDPEIARLRAELVNARNIAVNYQNKWIDVGGARDVALNELAALTAAAQAVVEVWEENRTAVSYEIVVLRAELANLGKATP